MVVTSRQHARRGTAGTPASRSFGRVRLFLRMRRGERIEVHARIEYPPEGLRCELNVPLADTTGAGAQVLSQSV